MRQREHTCGVSRTYESRWMQHVLDTHFCVNCSLHAVSSIRNGMPSIYGAKSCLPDQGHSAENGGKITVVHSTTAARTVYHTRTTAETRTFPRASRYRLSPESSSTAKDVDVRVWPAEWEFSPTRLFPAVCWCNEIIYETWGHGGGARTH